MKALKGCAAALLVLAAAAPLTACGPRQVEVRTGPQAASEVTLRVTNNLTQPLNVYVVNGGTDVFIKQVASSSAASMSVPGIPAGTTVELKATPADGSRTYTRDNVTLSGLYEWQVP
ncbi:MAG: hypothetical protein ACR2MQ_08270 [Gemmatimonadaceae bacterium]